LTHPEFAALVLSCGAAIHQQLYDLLEFQNEQIRILKRLLGKRPRASDAEKRRLAAQAQRLDRQVLEQAETMVTIDTFRRWYRQLIAQRYSSVGRGRPPLSEEVSALVCRLAVENPSWGYETIADRLAQLGHQVSHQTVGAILRRQGIPPAPTREKSNNWSAFLASHWPGLVALDSATWETPSADGRTTVRHVALSAIRMATREVRLLGVTDQPNGAWVTNCCRQLTAFDDVNSKNNGRSIPEILAGTGMVV
jgi:transposase